MAVMDLKPAAARLAALVDAVPDSALGNRTPCTDYTVGDLLDHRQRITVAFGGAADKAAGESATIGPAGHAANLAPDWRTSLAAKLAELAERWDSPEAWTGMTTVAGQRAPAEVVGVITFGELSVHGWDLSQGAGIALPDPAGLAALHALTSATFTGPDGDVRRGTAFRPPIAVAPDGGSFEQTLGVLGRDPHWKP